MKISSLGRVSAFVFLSVIFSKSANAYLFDNNPLFSWIGEALGGVPPVWIWRVIFFLLALFFFQIIVQFTLVRTATLTPTQEKAVKGIIFVLALGSALVMPVQPIQNMFQASGGFIYSLFFIGLGILVVYITHIVMNGIGMLPNPQIRIPVIIIVAILAIFLIMTVAAAMQGGALAGGGALGG